MDVYVHKELLGHVQAERGRDDLLIIADHTNLCISTHKHKHTQARASKSDQAFQQQASEQQRAVEWQAAASAAILYLRHLDVQLLALLDLHLS